MEQWEERVAEREERVAEREDEVWAQLEELNHQVKIEKGHLLGGNFVVGIAIFRAHHISSVLSHSTSFRFLLGVIEAKFDVS